MEIILNLDVGEFSHDTPSPLERILQLHPATKTKPAKARRLVVNAPGLHCGYPLQENLLSVADLLVQAVNLILREVAQHPKDFPRNLYPHGCADWKLTRLNNAGDGDWHLEARWKDEVLARTPSVAQPERAINLRRSPPFVKNLQSTAPFPDLPYLILEVEPSSERGYLVIDVREDEAGPMRGQPTQSISPAVQHLRYPAPSLPSLEWGRDIGKWRTPVTHALQMLALRSVGKTEEWLRPSWVEAVFTLREAYVEARDLRASLVSGPSGPAPLPRGASWPACPCCGRPALFSQSMDFRDLSYASLLPGSTAVIFVCNDCLEAGEWSQCSAVVWLDHAIEVVLQDRGAPQPLRQCVQFYGPDSKNRSDLEPALLDEIERLEEVASAPFLWLPPSYGTKAGGSPHYLQQEQIFFDKTGTRMEYIAQIGTPDHIHFGGFGYLSHSAITGETYIEFQDT